MSLKQTKQQKQNRTDKAYWRAINAPVYDKRKFKRFFNRQCKLYEFDEKEMYRLKVWFINRIGRSLHTGMFYMSRKR